MEDKKHINDILYLEKQLIDCIHQHIEAYMRNYDDDIYKHLRYIIDEHEGYSKKG